MFTLIRIFTYLKKKKDTEISIFITIKFEYKKNDLDRSPYSFAFINFKEFAKCFLLRIVVF